MGMNWEATKISLSQLEAQKCKLESEIQSNHVAWNLERESLHENIDQIRIVSRETQAKLWDQIGILNQKVSSQM
jgi:hypothetical protein